MSIPEFIKNIFSRKGKLSHYGRLNILIVVPYAPYPIYTGGTGRIYQKIKYFGLRHNVSVVCYYGALRNKPFIKKTLEPYCRKIKLIKREEPFIASRTHTPEKVYEKTTLNMLRALKRMRGKFDLVMFEHIYLAEYRTLFKDSFTILEEHNIESSVLKQLNNADNENLQAQKMQDYETANWPRFNLVTVVSERDSEEVKRRGNCKSIVVENGVDADAIKPVEYNNSNSLLYMGHLSYKPNVEAVKYLVRNIIPEVHKLLPDTQLCIAGANPAEEILALKNMDYIDLVADPPDMAKVASRCFVVVVPLFIGGGTRIKILEAMAMGVPVISTSLGCEGLAVKNMEHVIICDEPAEFATAILNVKNNINLGKHLRKNGQNLVRDRYKWEHIFTQYEKVLLSKMNMHADIN